jgi:hypothetical protein
VVSDPNVTGTQVFRRTEQDGAISVEREGQNTTVGGKVFNYRRHVSALVLGHHQVSKIRKKKTIQRVSTSYSA